jgi:hypothetical protein
MPEVVDLKSKRKRQPSSMVLVPLDQKTGAGRLFNKMVRDIEADLGGRRQLTRIEREWVQAFAGAATRVQYLNLQTKLGEEIDDEAFAKHASTMLKLGTKLGLRRRSKDVTPTLGDLIRHDQEAQRATARERETAS